MTKSSARSTLIDFEVYYSLDGRHATLLQKNSEPNITDALVASGLRDLAGSTSLHLSTCRSVPRFRTASHVQWQEKLFFIVNDLIVGQEKSRLWVETARFEWDAGLMPRALEGYVYGIHGRCQDNPKNDPMGCGEAFVNMGDTFTNLMGASEQFVK